MLPKEPSATTLSKSDTSNAKGQISLDTPIQFLKGVGPRLAQLLEIKGIRTIRDAVLYFPRDYQDRSTLKPINSIEIEESALIRGRITGHSYIPMRRLKRPMLQAMVNDGTGTLSLKWFQYNRTYMEGRLRERPMIVAYGTVKGFSGIPGMIHPDVDWDAEVEKPTTERILPIYSETEGLTQKILRKIVSQAVELASHLILDEIPVPIREAHHLKSLAESIRVLHNPPKNISLENLRAFNTPEQRRLIFDEFFKFEWIVGRRRLHLRREATKAYPKALGKALMSDMIKRLPFDLTGDQKHSIEKIFEDLDDPRPMNRLLQGDVGCGKTLVALCAALPVTAAGGQAALLAPTEILATQHLVNARRYLDGLVLPNDRARDSTQLPNIIPRDRLFRTELLAGSTPKAQREEILAALAAGKIDLLVGTHAILEDPVVFAELGLVLVDEQHRFGVDQRMRLRAKGTHPHVLSLTATPIPRTLALTAYGDLDVSVIRELPKGRPEIITRIIKEEERAAMFESICAELAAGGQAYIIYPLVEESEKIDLANAVSGADSLARGAFRDFKVGLLHGRMRPQEKAAVMDEFKAGSIRVLVSTTVVEVGVDVPNATVLVIENAERFGLSQLHQLRGRVGRGTKTSHCFLVTKGGAAESLARLRAMERTRDGFKLAELDLEIRGPGEFLGTRQSGELQFQYASLVRDQILLQEARKAAFDLLREDPELLRLEHGPLRAYMQRAGHLSQARLETA